MSPRYGFEVGMVLLIFLIAFAFAVVSPILLPMALVFFAMAWLFWRWALLYVYVRKYEGGGTMWPFIFARVMVCMVRPGAGTPVAGMVLCVFGHGMLMILDTAYY